jgi:hypothetical protein
MIILHPRAGFESTADAVSHKWKKDHCTCRCFSSALSLSFMMPGGRGDDLEDDFVADELVELSEEEGSLHELDDDSNDADEPTPAAAASPTSDSAAVSKKRKRREKEKEKRLKVRTHDHCCDLVSTFETGCLSSRNGRWLKQPNQNKSFPSLLKGQRISQNTLLRCRRNLSPTCRILS